MLLFYTRVNKIEHECRSNFHTNDNVQKAIEIKKNVAIPYTAPGNGSFDKDLQRPLLQPDSRM